MCAAMGGALQNWRHEFPHTEQLGTNINLPYLTVDASSPKHLNMKLTQGQGQKTGTTECQELQVIDCPRCRAELGTGIWA
ncbi:hypothetical protein AGOR_G00215580 [Albula goreensis]|uniref:Uncharacterized protein n=1 Tax=Albula goreensis TaxID=1534307 RepID=A0A8T3CMD0_9TELE|nr:hypothetical protein AGOR_G00215580 [Albula goreensis]